MNKPADIVFENNKFFISGDLNYSNVMFVYEKSLPQIEKQPELNFDFSQLKSSDSSGLALIVEWIKLARRTQKPIRFTKLSDDLLEIGKAAGLDALINEG